MENRYLFVYDIHLPKTMRKLKKLIDSVNGKRIQKSVFELMGLENEMLCFFEKVLQIVREGEDKVALIPLCEEDVQKTEMYGMISKRGEKEKGYYLL